ncbi:hypothetical protein As57867_012312, partial [Aphanomyces stellatus]
MRLANLTNNTGTADDLGIETIVAGRLVVNIAIDLHPDQAVLDSLKIYYVFFAVAFLAFELVRRCLRKHFNCRATPVAEASYSAFGWIRPVLAQSDDAILEHCGLDALCFLRLLRLGRNIALGSMVISIMLIPVYATASGRDSSSDWIV